MGSQVDDLDNKNRKYHNDMDEIEQEQREIENKKRMNLRFLKFSKRIEEIAALTNVRIEFDVPYKELAFYGNPHKSIVKLMPTLNCLVNLTDSPFFITPIEDVEIAHFERVMVRYLFSPLNLAAWDQELRYGARDEGLSDCSQDQYYRERNARLPQGVA